MIGTFFFFSVFFFLDSWCVFCLISYFLFDFFLAYCVFPFNLSSAFLFR